MFKRLLIFVVLAFLAVPASAQLILYDDEGRIEAIRNVGGNAVLRECLISTAASEGFECPDAGGTFLGRTGASWITNNPQPFVLFNLMTIGTLSEKAKTEVLLEHRGQDIDTSHLDDSTTIACVSCTFVANFVSALLAFSLAVFGFFRVAFLTLVPILFAIWLGYRASVLFVLGGEKGDQFLQDFTKKVAAFFVAFLIVITPSSSGDPVFWEAVGPEFLEFGFGVNQGLRDHMMDELANTWGGEGNPSNDVVNGLECGAVLDQMGDFMETPHAESVAPVVVAACLAERFHAVGVGMGMVSAYINFQRMGNVLELSFRGLGSRAGDLVSGLFGGIFGLFVAGIFLLSAIWLIFMFLDVIVKIFITAAIFPVFAAALLFKPSRVYATNGIKALIASFVSLVSLSFVMVLGFFMLMMIPDVYTMTYERYNQFEARGTAHLLQPLQTQSSMARFGEMVFRANIDPNSRDPEAAALYIPFHLSTPWFLYMLFVALSLFAVGKKIVKVIGGLFDVSGGSALADAALALTKNSALAAKGGAMLTIVAPGKSAGSFVWDNKGAHQARTRHEPNTQKSNNPFG